MGVNHTPANVILANRLKELIGKRAERPSAAARELSAKMDESLRVSHGAIERMLKADEGAGVTLAAVDRIAQHFGVSPWELLHPSDVPHGATALTLRGASPFRRISKADWEALGAVGQGIVEDVAATKARELLADHTFLARKR